MLTDEQIKDAVSDAKLSDYWYSHGDLLVLFARSIEAAVREEQAGEIARLKEELSIAKIGVRRCAERMPHFDGEGSVQQLMWLCEEAQRIEQGGA